MISRSLKNLFKDERRVREYWNRTGAHNLSKEELFLLKRSQLYDHTWAITVNFFIMAGQLKKKIKVLDAGCGWGRTIVGLKKEIPELKISAIDITPKLIDLAKQIMLDEIGTNDIDFKVGDIKKLEFDENSFDVIFSTRVLQYIDKPQDAIRELKRVAKLNSRIIVMVPNKLNPINFIKYHTKSYTPFDLKKWFKTENLKIINFGSIGFMPPFYRFKSKLAISIIVYFDRLFRNIPILKNFGGLAMCIGEK